MSATPAQNVIDFDTKRALRIAHKIANTGIEIERYMGGQMVVFDTREPEARASIMGLLDRLCAKRTLPPKPPLTAEQIAETERFYPGLAALSAELEADRLAMKGPR